MFPHVKTQDRDVCLVHQVGHKRVVLVWCRGDDKFVGSLIETKPSPARSESSRCRRVKCRLHLVEWTELRINRSLQLGAWAVRVGRGCQNCPEERVIPVPTFGNVDGSRDRKKGRNGSVSLSVCLRSLLNSVGFSFFSFGPLFSFFLSFFFIGFNTCVFRLTSVVSHCCHHVWGNFASSHLRRRERERES